MRKKIFYAGLSIFVIAIILLLASGSMYGNVLAKILTSVNMTISSGSFSYVPVETGNASLIAVYANMSGRANVYLLNASAFHSWSSNVNGNGSASGLAYAMALDTGNSSVITRNVSASQTILAKNPGTQTPNSPVTGLDKFDGAVYVVIDNTKGSASYGTALRAVVAYFRLTPANLGIYDNILLTEAVIILLGVAGIIVMIYGALKKAPDAGAAIYPKDKGGEAASKEYIDSLYKHVDKKKGKRKGA